MAADLSGVANYVESLRIIKAEMAKLKEAEEACKEKIMEALGDEEEGHIDGKLVLHNRWKYPERVNVKLLREEIPWAALERYITKNEAGERAGIRLVD